MHELAHRKIRHNDVALDGKSISSSNMSLLATATLRIHPLHVSSGSDEAFCGKKRISGSLEITKSQHAETRKTDPNRLQRWCHP